MPGRLPCCACRMAADALRSICHHDDGRGAHISVLRLYGICRNNTHTLHACCYDQCGAATCGMHAGLYHCCCCYCLLPTTGMFAPPPAPMPVAACAACLQVDDAAARVHALRQGAPKHVSDALAAQAAAQRPLLHALQGGASAEATAAAAATPPHGGCPAHAATHMHACALCMQTHGHGTKLALSSVRRVLLWASQPSAGQGACAWLSIPP